MKKLVVLIIAFFIFCCAYINYEHSSYFKIFKMNSPSEIFVDTNKNFIFDEEQPIKIENIYSISDLDEDIDFNKKFLIDYLSKEEADKLLRIGFLKIKDNKILIQDTDYREYLLNTGFFFDNSSTSREKFKNNIEKYKVDDYVIVNTRSNKYHNITCENARKIKNYKIIKRENLNNKYLPAKCCQIPQNNVLRQINDNLKTQEFKQVISDGSINVYFIDFFSVDKPNNKCLTEACISLKNQIDSASKTINFAIYGFNNQPEIYNALKRAKDRGVKIRWVCNYDKSENAYYPEVAKLQKLLPDYKTNKNDKTKQKIPGLMHNKFFIFDNNSVYTGSANITATDLSGFNSNYTILIKSKDVAKIFENEFEQMYEGKFSKQKSPIDKEIIELSSNEKISIFFSPADSIINNVIINYINNSKKYIYIPTFFITDKKILSALIDAHNRNVEIKIITDATSAASKYTIHKQLRNEGILVKTENFAGKMHSKSLIIDDKYAIIGSMNLTSSGNKRNDENIVIIDSEKIAKYMKSTFIHLWNKIPDKYLKYDPKAESTESIGSCFDGIDNDFDGKIDSLDDGCFIKQY